MRISDWSSDVCSSDLNGLQLFVGLVGEDDPAAEEIDAWRLGPAIGDARLAPRAPVGGQLDADACMGHRGAGRGLALQHPADVARADLGVKRHVDDELTALAAQPQRAARHPSDDRAGDRRGDLRSEEHTSELQSLMRISYSVFC